MTSRLSRTLAATAVVLAVAAPAFEAAAAPPAPPAPPPPPETPFVAKLLPVAAGTLVGAAAGFFIVPVLVPGVAVAAAAGPPTSPLFGFVGAGLGALIGTTQAPK
ncbi:hypothetical protein [Azospirillum sp. TSO22-1]|uniref:hypothetical protein n=1 Tax=Azospirillum sp. TSO22-1 TaxID=716789 RepID=UPI000D6422F3|nr:hypothetical protein [Azospirillum sp. TSO22-1]